MKLTVEQRLRALERDNVILHDTVKVLHKMLKDQSRLISEYLTLKLARSNGDDGDKGKNGRPCEEIYSFVCKRRLDQTEQNVEKMRKSIESLKCNSRVS